MKSRGDSEILKHAAEYLHQATQEIRVHAGLRLVSDSEHMSLYAPGSMLVARVPHSTDVPSDIDRLRAVWFHTAIPMTNTSWD